MRARDVMSSPVSTVGADASLLDAAKLLVNMKISALPVVDGRSTVVGILSEADLIRSVMGSQDKPFSIAPSALDHAESHQALSRRVGEIMTSPVITAAEDAPLEHVASLILQSRTKRIPILRGESMVGIVSRIDLVKAMLSRTPEGHAANDSAADDEGLRRQVGAAMEKLGIPLGAAFDVVVRHGVAHLWGRLASQQENQAVQAAAARVSGISDVMSHMQVIRWAR